LRRRIRIERALDMRYAGRATRSPSPARQPLQDADLKQLRAAFDQQHQAMFGHMAPEEPVEIVSYRVRGIGSCRRSRCRSSSRPAPRWRCAARDAARALRRQELDCPVYQRERLDVGLSVAGRRSSISSTARP
jgi:N-methylhydantoinase A